VSHGARRTAGRGAMHDGADPPNPRPAAPAAPSSLPQNPPRMPARPPSPLPTPPHPSGNRCTVQLLGQLTALQATYKAACRRHGVAPLKSVLALIEDATQEQKAVEKVG
jgi:hypothetical protein